MKVIFLGTGPSVALPRKNCRCETCVDAKKLNSRSRRGRSSLLVNFGGKNFLFDASPDVLEQLSREKIKKIDYVFLTHGHADAVGGLKCLFKFLKDGPILYTEAETGQRLGIKKFKSIKIGEQIKINGLSIIPFRVRHSMTPGFPTLGYRIGRDLIYASDVGEITKLSFRYLQDAKYLILDGSMWFGKKIKSHLRVDEAIKLAINVKAKKLYLTQISHTYPPYEKAVREIRAYLKKQKITLPVIVAFDSLKFRV